MKKLIILSILIDIALAGAMAAGVIPSVWWIVFVSVGIQLVITMIIGFTRKKRCRHAFESKIVMDWNDDPKCLLCGAYLAYLARIEGFSLIQIENKPSRFEQRFLGRYDFGELTWFDRVILKRKPLPKIIHVPRR